MPDIDIDFADRNVVLDKLKHRIAKLDTGKAQHRSLSQKFHNLRQRKHS